MILLIMDRDANSPAIFISQREGFGELGKGPFINYVYKRRGVGGQKNCLFVNFHTIEKVNEGG